MITEIAPLKIKEGLSGDFEVSFKKASKLISSMQGYIEHELLRCMEEDNRYILIVRWEKLEDHTIGFRNSREYKEWKGLLHHFYDPFPVVEHFENITLKD